MAVKKVNKIVLKVPTKLPISMKMIISRTGIAMNKINKYMNKILYIETLV